MRALFNIAAALFGLFIATACEHHGDLARAGGLSRPEAYREAATLRSLGRKMFVDPSLSGSGAVSCASCHSPDRAFAPPNARAVQPGGRNLTAAGRRAAPSLMYLQTTPPFTAHSFDADYQHESEDGGPTGGLTWDGRVDRGRTQARLPLLSPDEMANDSPTDVAAKLARASYAADVEAFAGQDIFARPDDAFNVLLRALEAYEQDEVFYPYSSEYDAYLAGEATLSPNAEKGLALFNDPAKGNCARCHTSARGSNGTLPQFTDYGLVALGVPRNHEIPANADAAYYDLGLCGPLRTDVSTRADYCGRFMTPTLRNVATRQSFYHNGVVHSLKEAVAFYATRDTSPEKWLSRDARGNVRVFDDLPAMYHANVEQDPPFGRHAGDPPALTDQEVDDIVTFLGTLTDGFRRR